MKRQEPVKAESQGYRVLGNGNCVYSGGSCYYGVGIAVYLPPVIAVYTC
jgi:hypothetical protein